MRISDRNLPKMVSNPGKETSYTDDALKGFTLRVTANGQKVFYYRYVSPIVASRSGIELAQRRR